MNGVSMFQLYRNACEVLGWIPRRLIEEALRRLDEGVNPLIVKLPTGYGKTSITLSMGLACRESGASWLRVIHVLPMRSIVDDVEFRLRENLQKIGLAEIGVYKQYMGSPMTPFYCGRGIIVTTLDTFMMNLFKVPASEFRKLIELGYAHYDIPRANIYSSAIVFDEFHLLSGLGGLSEELKSLASTLAAVRALCEVGVPLVISTATLPEILVEAISRILMRAGIEFHERNILRWGELRDKSFEEYRRTVKVSLEVIEKHDVMKILKKGRGRRVLFVANKVERAVEIFRKIRQSLGAKTRVILLHGRLREDVKRQRVKDIDEAKVVVATQVIEAGIDKSFDILITDPCPLDRLIQRAGRVARFRGSASGKIYVIEPMDDEPYSGVYSRELTKDSMSALEELIGSSFPKLEFEETLLGKMEQVYSRHISPTSLLDFRRLRILIDLDEQPLLGREDAKQALTNLEGFTDSFGLVTIFDASEIGKDLSYELSVGVSENMARKILESEGIVVVRSSSLHSLGECVNEVVKDIGEFKLIRLRKELIKKLLNGREPLTISLLKHGIEGLAVERIDPVEGLVRI